MKKIIVAAYADNRVIGRAGDLPWHLPADLAFFERTIADGWLLSGRRSYESAQGKAIFTPDRQVVVVTQQKDYQALGHSVAHTLSEAVQQAEQAGAGKLYILGGGEIYRQAIDIADQLIITEVHATFTGDAFFPPIDARQWREAKRQDHAADAENPYAYSFVTWQRRPPERLD